MSNKRKLEIEQWYKDHANDPMVINDRSTIAGVEESPRFALYGELKVKSVIPWERYHNWYSYLK